MTDPDPDDKVTPEVVRTIVFEEDELFDIEMTVHVLPETLIVDPLVKVV
jgi:hypothetical protein